MHAKVLESAEEEFNLSNATRRVNPLEIKAIKSSHDEFVTAYSADGSVKMFCSVGKGKNL